MAEHTERLQAFVKLGALFRNFYSHKNQMAPSGPNEDTWTLKLGKAMEQAEIQNAWFTENSMLHALAAWGEALREESLLKWLQPYPLAENRKKTIAIIMAGNIPMVGFHDLLCVLLTGNTALVKLSADDRALISFAAEFLMQEHPGFRDAIAFAEGPLKGYEAVIATGSTNTSRYFEYYFGKKPHIIRKNRQSAAVLTGRETTGDLQALGRDIFTYFGLGCRNVSKLFVPDSYDFRAFYEALSPYESLLQHRKYGNNYEYNKAVYLMSEFDFLDNGFLLLKEDPGMASPIGSLYFERYTALQPLKEKLALDSEQRQCLVGNPEDGFPTNFGTTQQPELWDYADKVDTVDFLLKT